MAPQVLYRVLFGDSKPRKKKRDQLTIVPALLHSYCRHKVYMADYPGIIPQEGKSVLGVYVTGLDDLNIARLDIFEGDQYRREKVKVRLLDNVRLQEGVHNLQVGRTEGQEVEAETYVFEDKDDLVEEEWDYQEFVREKMWRWADTSEEYDGECCSRSKAGRHG
jgi:Gamma-glutamyl cyclotransferase, AIG2-like